MTTYFNNKESINFKGHTIKVTSFRLKKEERQEGKYYYEVRAEDENQFIPAMIVGFAFINHWGTIESDTPIDLGETGIILTEEEADQLLSII